MANRLLKTSQIVVITGAASGIGLAASSCFANEGYEVAALDINQKKLRAMMRSRFRRQIHPYVCDMEKVAEIQKLCERIRREIGDPKIIINNAGMHIRAGIEDIDEAIWKKSLNINLISAAALIRGFIPAMKKIRGAAIVNVCSRNALSSSPESATYDAAKAGLLALTRTLALDFGKWGIRVNALLPGVIDTPIHGKLLKEKIFQRNYRKLIPLNRFGTAEEMANIIFFLASSRASFITGQGIIADGGQIAGQNYAKIFG